MAGPNRCLLWVAALCAALQGCAGVAISSGTYAVKASGREALLDAAEAGDAQAQYELGKSWCCMGPGFDTETATRWLCRAAAQGHGAALYELGRIYDGDVSRTPAPGQKLVRLLSAESSPAHALAFHRLAAQAGHEPAAQRLAQLDAAASSALRAEARALAADIGSHCEYRQVFADAPR
ncbi:MAG: sel1 repeat family protein [Rhodocyclaceae bacterium]|nr:sel1 repeat family protein [Rhodocyclaceae bacterium]